MSQKLYRSSKDQIISGVMGGLALYLKVDPTLLRIGAVLMGLFAPQVIIAYIVCMILVPKMPAEMEEEETEILDAEGNRIQHRPQNARLILGIGIVAFGVIQLMHHFLWWIDKEIYWGVGIIGIGIVVLMTAIKRKQDEN